MKIIIAIMLALALSGCAALSMLAIAAGGADIATKDVKGEVYLDKIPETICGAMDKPRNADGSC